MKYIFYSFITLIFLLNCSMKQEINVDFDVSSIDSIIIEPTKLNEAYSKRISLNEKSKIELVYTCIKNSKRNAIKFMPLYSIKIHYKNKVDEYLIAEGFLKYKGVPYNVSEKLYHLIEKEYKK